MAVAFDAGSSQDNGAVQNPSLTHTPVGTPTGAMIFVGWRATSIASIALDSVTYGGAACTLIGSVQTGTNIRAALYGIANPAAGAQTVQANFSAAPNRESSIHVITVTGSSTSAVSKNTAFYNDTVTSNPAATVTSDADDLCFSGCVGNGVNITGVSDQTEVGSEVALSGGEVRASYEIATGSSVEMLYSMGGAGSALIVAATFEPAGAGGGGVSTTVGAVSAAASVTGFGGSDAFATGASTGQATAAGVGANANAGEKEAVGTSTGLTSVVGVGQSEVFTVGNSAGSAAVVGVGEAIAPPGQSVGIALGLATVSGVASSIAQAVGSSHGSSDASGVNPQVVVTQRLIVGAGGELSWEDHVKAIHDMRMLEGQIREQKKELKKVEKKLKTVEKKVKTEKNDGILANLLSLEMKRDEIENKIQAYEVDLKPLIMAMEQMEIEEDDAEFMSMQ